MRNTLTSSQQWDKAHILLSKIFGKIIDYRTLCYMAECVYQTSTPDPRIIQSIAETGFSSIAELNKEEYIGYYERVFINYQKRAIIIVSKGTYYDSCFPNNAATITCFSRGEIDPSLEQISKFIDGVRDKEGKTILQLLKDGYHCICTGHSLGGALSQFVHAKLCGEYSAQYNREAPKTLYSICYDSIGAGLFLRAFASPQKEGVLGVYDHIAKHSSNFVLQPNTCNTFSDHVGYTIFLDTFEKGSEPPALFRQPESTNSLIGLLNLPCHFLGKFYSNEMYVVRGIEISYNSIGPALPNYLTLLTSYIIKKSGTLPSSLQVLFEKLRETIDKISSPQPDEDQGELLQQLSKDIVISLKEMAYILKNINIALESEQPFSSSSSSMAASPQNGGIIKRLCHKLQKHAKGAYSKLKSHPATTPQNIEDIISQLGTHNIEALVETLTRVADEIQNFIENADSLEVGRISIWTQVCEAVSRRILTREGEIVPNNDTECLRCISKIMVEAVNEIIQQLQQTPYTHPHTLSNLQHFSYYMALGAKAIVAITPSSLGGSYTDEDLALSTHTISDSSITAAPSFATATDQDISDTSETDNELFTPAKISNSSLTSLPSFNIVAEDASDDSSELFSSMRSFKDDPSASRSLEDYYTSRLYVSNPQIRPEALAAAAAAICSVHQQGKCQPSTSIADSHEHSPPTSLDIASPSPASTPSRILCSTPGSSIGSPHSSIMSSLLGSTSDIRSARSPSNLESWMSSPLPANTSARVLMEKARGNSQEGSVPPDSTLYFAHLSRSNCSPAGEETDLSISNRRNPLYTKNELSVSAPGLSAAHEPKAAAISTSSPSLKNPLSTTPTSQGEKPFAVPKPLLPSNDTVSSRESSSLLKERLAVKSPPTPSLKEMNSFPEVSLAHSEPLSLLSSPSSPFTPANASSGSAPPVLRNLIPLPIVFKELFPYMADSTLEYDENGMDLDFPCDRADLTTSNEMHDALFSLSSGGILEP
jgi:hypothetical protein